MIETVDIHGKQHPTWAGVLNEAHGSGLVSIETKLIQAPLPENSYMAIVHATATDKDGKVFTGIGDATPKNVNAMIAPHIVRMAETRAKGRALRDMLNIGEALAEELGEVKEDLSAVLENDVYDQTMKDSVCKKCGGAMKKSAKGNWYCTNMCWKE